MFSLKSKKASHVGIMLSFAIFVTFLIFILLTLTPSIKIQNNNEFIFDSLKTSLIQNLTENLTVVSIKTLEPTSEKDDCFSIEIPDYSNLNIVAKKNNFVIDSSSRQGKFYVSSATTNGEIYKLYLSDKIPVSESSCSDPTEVNFEINSINSYNYVFIGNLEILKNQNYQDLKKHFNVPETTEFIIEFQDTTSVPPKDIKIGYDGQIPNTNVYSDKISIIYFNEKAEIKSGFINLKVW